uniref:RRM domain-containing protein n=1 Tax=Glossina brevipalpis TaxID=37001 RepID=A0A1A9W5R3_9MUSC
MFMTKNDFAVASSDASNPSSDEDYNNKDERTLFCANLHAKVSEELFYEAFEAAGSIERAHIPKDERGRSRLYGFITYVNRSSCCYALKFLKGLTLYGKMITIKFSQPRRRKRELVVSSMNYEGNKERRSNYNQVLHDYNQSLLPRSSMNRCRADQNERRGRKLRTSKENEEYGVRQSSHYELRRRYYNDRSNGNEHRIRKSRTRKHSRERDEDYRHRYRHRHQRYHQRNRSKNRYRCRSSRR